MFFFIFLTVYLIGVENTNLIFFLVKQISFLKYKLYNFFSFFLIFLYTAIVDLFL